MAKQGQRAEVNTFVQGLISEASPLNFPPNATKDEANFELYRNGTRKRRLGIDFEEGAVLRPVTELTDRADPIFNSYVWESVGGQSERTYLVVQVGNVLQMYNMDSYPLTAEGGGYIGEVGLPTSNKRYSFTSIDGSLVVATGEDYLYIVDFDQNADKKFVRDSIVLKVRDQWGVDTADAKTEDDIYYRPLTISPNHSYNLQNQSWGVPRKNQGGTLTDPVNTYFTEIGSFPSNSEVVWTGLQFQPVLISSTNTKGDVSGTSQLPFERIYPNLYSEVFGLAPLAAKGYFIIDALNRGASRKAAFTENFEKHNKILYPPEYFTPPEDKTPGGPSVVTSFAGRVFYAGFDGQVINGDARSPTMNNIVLFSQLVKNKRDLAKCYQEGDPTSREGADLVDTDGGYIKIGGATTILAMHPIGNNLIVIADNGVWTITGGSDYGFSATNYKVGMLSSYGCCAAASIIEQGNNLFFWGEEGIYGVARNNMGDMSVESISQSTIQFIYNQIPLTSKQAVKAVYDESNRRIRWLYKLGTQFTDSSVTRELLLDVDLKSFFMFVIKPTPTFSVEVQDVFHFRGYTGYVTYIKDGNGDRLYTISKYRDGKFRDWRTFDGVGVDAAGYLWTGDQVAGDSGVHKQVPYVIVHMEQTENATDSDGIPLNPSSCWMYATWDFTGGLESGKVSNGQQVYRYRRPLILRPNSQYSTGFEVITTKNKLRGRGRAFALMFETVADNDCHLLGWNLTLTGDSVV